jgi:beta-xylosidase
LVFRQETYGFYRLNCIVRPENTEGLWNVPNLLLQKFPSEEFTATTKLTFNARTNDEEAGFVIMGEDYQFISLKKKNDKLMVRTVQCKNARTGGNEMELFTEEFDGNEIYFRVEVEKGAVCRFSYSKDGKKFINAGPAFEAKPGRWIGAKIGYFAFSEGITNDAGTVDIDWFRIEK